MRRVIAAFLAAVMVCVMLPAWGIRTEAAAEPELEEQIKKQVRAYADSIDQSDAAVNAAADLAYHGLRGKGSTMTMGASSPLAAMLLNSEVVQEGFAVVFADVIQSMLGLDMRSVPGVCMSFGWYGTKNDYSGYILTDSKEYPDNLDWMVTKNQYTGSMNSYDDALEWMVGTCEATAVVECIKDTGSVKTYKVTATFADRFDFNTANTSGFKQLLSGIGMRLFREFDWNCTVTMNITVPYSYDHCRHISGAYHWTYDAENRAMISDSGGTYLRNNTTHRSETASDGTVHHYYKLESTIRLYHNKPWVLEYDVCTPSRIVFAPVDNAVTKTHPQIVQSARTSLFVVSKDYAMAENKDGNLDRYYAYNYYGTKFQTLFPYANDKTYTIRLENVISGDGSNRILLSVVETGTGECCLDRVPMDDHYYHGGWMEKTELISEESGWLSGKDIHINYFGTAIAGFDAKMFDLRIWENGVDGKSGDSFSEKVVAPTCTADGYTVKTCVHCGYSKTTAVVPATGHDFSSWTRTAEPDCETAGKEYAVCGVCGHREERAVPATGHGGGIAICVLGKVCDVCGKAYGEKDPDNHAFGTEVRSRVEPTEFADGYSGDVHCKGCGVMLEAGKVISATHTHSYAEAWSADETNHWHACSCGEKAEAAAHIPGPEPTEEMGQLCTVCGWELKPVHTHTLQKVEGKDATHTEDGNVEYYVCSCGKWFADANGAELIEDHDSVRIAPYELGDVDHDHKLTSMDSMLILQYKAGLLPVDFAICEQCADVDGKMGINSMDAMLLLQFRAGLITSFR